MVLAEGNIGDTILRDVNQIARNPELNTDIETAISDIVTKRIEKEDAKAERIENYEPKKFPNGTMGTAHAEVGVLQQAADKGLTEGAHLDMTVYGEPICSYCRSDIAKMADRIGLDSMRVKGMVRLNETFYETIFNWQKGGKLIEDVSKKKILGPK